MPTSIKEKLHIERNHLNVDPQMQFKVYSRRRLPIELGGMPYSTLLDSFKTLEEAQEAYPEAEFKEFEF